MSAASVGRAGSVRRLREVLLAGGGLMATLVCPEHETPSADPAGPAALAASGPRAREAAADYELLVDAIYEGYLLHYGEPRVVRVPDPDLRVLAGDRLYAIGLARLVALGDTAAVAELADTISLSALAHGAGSQELAGSIWTAGARAVGWGPDAEHARAKELVLAGSPEAFEAMRTSALGSAKPD